MSKYSRAMSISKISKKSKKLTRRGTVTVDPHESFIKYAAEFEAKLDHMKTQILQETQKSNQSFIENKMIEIQNSQSELHKKAMKIINECDARTRDVEQNILSVVKGYQKRQERKKIDADAQLTQLKDSFKSFGNEMGAIKTRIEEINSIVAKIDANTDLKQVVLPSFIEPPKGDLLGPKSSRSQDKRLSHRLNQSTSTNFRTNMEKLASNIRKSGRYPLDSEQFETIQKAANPRVADIYRTIELPNASRQEVDSDLFGSSLSFANKSIDFARSSRIGKPVYVAKSSMRSNLHSREKSKS